MKEKERENECKKTKKKRLNNNCKGLAKSDARINKS
jgi:hypothetical protein